MKLKQVYEALRPQATSACKRGRRTTKRLLIAEVSVAK